MKAKNGSKSKLLLMGAIAVAIVAQALIPTAVLADDHCRRLGVPIMGIEEVCEQSGEPEVDQANGRVMADNLMFAYLVVVVRLLTSGVGIVIALMIAVSGVQYAAAGGNSQKIEAAKTKLVHTIEALVLFIFLVAIINFLIPGGLL